MMQGTHIYSFGTPEQRSPPLYDVLQSPERSRQSLPTQVAAVPSQPHCSPAPLSCTSTVVMAPTPHLIHFGKLGLAVLNIEYNLCARICIHVIIDNLILHVAGVLVELLEEIVW